MDKEMLQNEVMSILCKTNESRVDFCKFLLQKHRMEKYSLKDNNIKEEDFILSDKGARELCNKCITENLATGEQIETILDTLSFDDLVYMGI